MSPTEDQGQGPVIRDRRRIDPMTGQVRGAAETGQPGGSGGRDSSAPAGQQDPSSSGSQRGPGAAGGHSRPGRHSVSRPGGATSSAGTTGTGPRRDEPEPGDEPADASTAGKGPADAEGAGTARAEAHRESPAPPAGGGRGSAEPTAAQAATMLAERTADLQRLQAEYANYRKRVERDRLAVREQALANVLTELLPVLDDIGRAREHGELSGGFKSVADSLEAIAVKLGLTSFGENGDPFDPTLHDALMHEYSNAVSEPTAVKILQPGYKVGDRIIRPARVAVAEPGGDDAGERSGDDEPGSPADPGDGAAD
jgi:molecular chaperone GrpE